MRDVAAELRVAGAIDLAHAARAEEGDDLVHADLGTGGERRHTCAVDYTPARAEPDSGSSVTVAL